MPAQLEVGPSRWGSRCRQTPKRVPAHSVNVISQTAVPGRSSIWDSVRWLGTARRAARRTSRYSLHEDSPPVASKLSGQNSRRELDPNSALVGSINACVATKVGTVPQRAEKRAVGVMTYQQSAWPRPTRSAEADLQAFEFVVRPVPICPHIVNENSCSLLFDQ